jgi:hypothetical protein
MPAPSTRRTLGRVDVRYMCESCGTKWFVPSRAIDGSALADCAACGGALKHVGFAPGEHDWAPGGRDDDYLPDAPA